MKKIITFLILLIAITIPTKNYAAQTFTVKIDNKNTKVNQVVVKVDGNVLKTKFSAYTINGRTFVPIRELTESLGANVSWDNKTKSATISNNGQSIKLKIDSEIIYIDNVKNTLSNDSIPKFAFYSVPSAETKTMVPLRFLSETFGYTVKWDQKTQTASVFTTADEASSDENTQNTATSNTQNTAKANTSNEKTKNDTVTAEPLNSNMTVIEPTETNGYRSQNEINQVKSLTIEEKAVEVQKNRVISKTIKAQGPVTIVVDAGHGGKDSGGLAKDGYKEKVPALKVAKLLQEKLQNDGYEVIMTRSKDEYIELLDRAGIANDENAELFLSIHFNISANSDASGIETFYANENKVGIKTVEQKYFAVELQKALIEETQAVNRGAKDGSSYIVLNKTETVAALAELGFLSNANDLEKIKDDEYIEKLAQGLYNGINNYVAKYVEK